MDLTEPGYYFARDALFRTKSSHAIRLGLILSLSGPMGVTGASTFNSALLAASEAQEAYGDVELVLIDAGAGPVEVCQQIEELIQLGAVDILVGTHMSDVREAVTLHVAGRVPYIFTPPREFAANTSDTIFLGADPREQMLEAVVWISHAFKPRKWALLGNDYLWPRQVHAMAREFARMLDFEIVSEQLTPRGSLNAAAAVRAIETAKADAVFLSLIGSDLVNFLRYIHTRARLTTTVKVSSTLDENVLLAAGGDRSGTLFSAMPTFARTATERHARYAEHYARHFGPVAPAPTAYGESCYDGVHSAIAFCARRDARSSNRDADLMAVLANSASAAGRGKSIGPVRQMSLAVANGFEFDVLKSSIGLWSPR